MRSFIYRFPVHGSFLQVFQPWIQRRRIAYALHKQVMSGFLRRLKSRAIGKLVTDEGKPDVDVIERLFEKLDKDSNGVLSPEEIRGLVVGIQFDEVDMDVDDAVSKVIEDLDISEDSHVDKDEFVRGISRWLHKAMRSAGRSNGDGSLHIARVLKSFQRVHNRYLYAV